MENYLVNEDPFIFRLNDNGYGPSLLVKLIPITAGRMNASLRVCAERGWRLYQGYITGGEDKWNLWWRSSPFPAGCYKKLGDGQFMNHIPKGGSICRKDGLSRLLRCMKKVYGNIYDFSPPCYHLPLEYAKLVLECARNRYSDEGRVTPAAVWIHKPVAQSQGRGIYLFRNIGDMRCGTAAVVQKYIERPLLIAGYKFDLRLYVCVPGYRPLTAYMYAEGLARFGTDKYTLTDINNPYRHITNSSLNKTGPRYAECKNRIGNGCKWTLKQVRRVLVARCGVLEWLVWQRIRALVTLTLLAQATGTPPARNCFEFYGFDVLVDDSMKPWLLEVNLSPALAADCEADYAVKRPMLHELFDLLGLPMRHTGLSLLKGPPLTLVNNGCTSDDESVSPKTPPRSAKKPTRRSRYSHSRSVAPLNCVTIQHPMALKSDKPVGGRGTSKPLPNISADLSDLQLSVALEPEDEQWRGGYATAASRRRMLKACTWGNGVRWDRAVGRVGQWVRIYPHSIPTNELQIEDARETVANVSKFVRAAREVAREFRVGGAREEPDDAACETALRTKLQCGSSFQVWLPPN